MAVKPRRYRGNKKIEKELFYNLLLNHQEPFRIYILSTPVYRSTVQYKRLLLSACNEDTCQCSSSFLWLFRLLSPPPPLFFKSNVYKYLPLADPYFPLLNRYVEGGEENPFSLFSSVMSSHLLLISNRRNCNDLFFPPLT